MHALIVIAHPEPRSYNHALAATAADALRARGATVEVSDLYAEGFDPLEGPRHFTDRLDPERFDAQGEQRHAWDGGTTSPEVLRELDRVARADLLVFQFPVWWFAQPAILKGWFDRVLVYGGTYTSKQRYDAGMWRGKRALTSVTVGGPEPTFAYNGRNGDIDLLLWPFLYSLFYMGLDVLPPQVAYEVGNAIAYGGEDAKAARLAAALEALGSRIATLDDEQPLPFNGWGDLDADGRLRPGVAGTSAFVRDDPERLPRRR